MAVRAPNGPERNSLGKFQSPQVVLEAATVREAAAKLYGLGFKRAQVAAAMAHVLTPDGNVKTSRRKLARWEQEQDFRDLIFSHAVVKADLEVPAILGGIAKAAKKGRVDAAKLILGITDRYSDKSDMPTEVTISLAGTMPRPASTTDRDLPRERELSGREILPPEKEG
jgi:hypothetical protein